MYLVHEDDDDAPGRRYYPCIRRGKDEEPKLSAEEEYLLISEQVEDSQVLVFSFIFIRSIYLET